MMNNKNQEFLHNEELGRAKLADFFGNKAYQVTFTQDPYDQKDAWITLMGTSTKYAAEIKNRNEQYEHYSTYIMEKNKYDELKRLYESNQIKDGIMAYFFGNRLYMFNLKSIDNLIEKNYIKLEYKWLPNSTVDFSQDVYKPCYLLPKTFAWQYEKINNKWILKNRP